MGRQLVKKLKTVSLANTVISIRDIWQTQDESEKYLIKDVSNTIIKALTIGDWIGNIKREYADSDYLETYFTSNGWSHYVTTKGFYKSSELDKSIRI